MTNWTHPSQNAPGLGRLPWVVTAVALKPTAPRPEVQEASARARGTQRVSEAHSTCLTCLRRGRGRREDRLKPGSPCPHRSGARALQPAGEAWGMGSHPGDICLRWESRPPCPAPGWTPRLRSGWGGLPSAGCTRPTSPLLPPGLEQTNLGVSGCGLSPQGFPHRALLPSVLVSGTKDHRGENPGL